MYSIVHPFGGDEATKHAWMRGFYEAAKAEGQIASVEFTAGTFFIIELDAVAPGVAGSVVWDIDNCLCVANAPVQHTGLKGEPCFLQTTPLLNDRTGPTPASLTKMVEAQNLMSNIKSGCIDMDTDTGSGSSGGAMEARFKALEVENAKLRREMGEIATTMKEVGANMNAGFRGLMQGQQQGMAALLARIQGADASVAMLGHAVAGLPGTSFSMPSPSATAVTGYRGSGGVIANGAGADAAVTGANVTAAAVSETALVAITPPIDPRLVGAPFPATTAAASGQSETHIGAPMCPEHSGGLDDGELPVTVTTAETRFQRLRRIALYPAGLLVAPSASDEVGAVMGSVATAEGRRSARLTSTTETGDGSISAPAPLHNCRTVGCLRQATGPFSPAACGVRELHCCLRCYGTDGRRHSRECNESTTDLSALDEAVDIDGAVNGGGVTQPRTAANIRAERMVLDRLQAPRLTFAEALASIGDRFEDGGSALMGTGWEAYYEPRSVGSASTARTGDDGDMATDGGTTQGTVEGPLTWEATVGTTDGHDGAALPTMSGRLALCGNADRCNQDARSHGGSQYCCDRCFQTNATEHNEHCRWWHTTSSGTMESTLNVTTPATMDF